MSQGSGHNEVDYNSLLNIQVSMHKCIFNETLGIVQSDWMLVMIRIKIWLLEFFLQNLQNRSFSAIYALGANF